MRNNALLWNQLNETEYLIWIKMNQLRIQITPFVTLPLRHLSNIDFPQTNLCNNEQSLNITCQLIFVWGSQYFLLPKPRFDGPVIVVQIIKSKPAQWFRYSYVIQRKVINRYMTGIWEFFVPQLTKSYSYTLLKTIRRGYRFW